MFNLFKPKDQAPSAPLTPIAGAGMESAASIGPMPTLGDGGAEHLAKFETLGQVLVVTILPQTISGPEAQDLMGDVVGRSAYAPIAPGEPIGAHNGKPRHFVMDLQNVEHMDSACLGVMVQTLQVMQGKGGRIALVNAGRNVEYLFRLTQLDRVFPICRDVMKAIEAVERGLGGATQPAKPAAGKRGKGW
ncbi:MAG: STAS domain-containing protein [Planctomycetota bacterium]